MARTRTQIKALIALNTGRTDKGTLIDSVCDTALKIAATRHPFQDILKLCDDETITEDATSVDISDLQESSSSVGTVADVITARIVEADGTRNKILTIKNRQWWDRNVVNPEDNQKGWPNFGLKFGTNMILDRPSENNLELRLRVSVIPTFASDESECPISILDLYVEQYVTAMVFLSLEMNDNYWSWFAMALGSRYNKGEIGGSLLAAIEQDRSTSAESKNVERGISPVRENGVAVMNQITGAPRYGGTFTWY